MIITASKLENLLKNLTDVMQFFVKTSEQLGISSSDENWKVSPTAYISTWQLSYTSEFDKGFERVKAFEIFGPISARFGIYYGQLYFSIDLTSKNAKSLIKDVLDDKKFITTLTNYLLQHKKITLKDYKILYNEAPKMEKIDEIARVLAGWTAGYTYKQAMLYAEKLEQLTPYIPKKYLKSPSNILYRAILVKSKAFEKLLKRNKPLVLKNRKYSSWTYRLNASLKFGYNHKEEGYVVVILRQFFPQNQIILNIEKLGLFLVEVGKFNSSQMLIDEKEILVKNPKENFIITQDQVYKYLQKVGEKWQKIK